MRLLHGPAAAITNGKQHRRHHQLLRPGPPQKVCSKAEIGHPHHRESACIHHRHRMKQRCHRGRSHTGLGQPVSKRPHSCLYTESKYTKHVDPQQCIRPLVDVGHIQHTSRYKGRGGTVYQHKYHANEGKCRTSQHIVQIGSAGKSSLSGSGMHHKGQSDKTQHFKKEVHGQNVLRQGHSKGNTVGKHIKQIKAFLILLMLHILKGIQHGKGPQEGRQARKDTTHTVHTQCHA